VDTRWQPVDPRHESSTKVVNICAGPVQMMRLVICGQQKAQGALFMNDSKENVHAQQMCIGHTHRAFCPVLHTLYCRARHRRALMGGEEIGRRRGSRRLKSRRSSCAECHHCARDLNSALLSAHRPAADAPRESRPLGGGRRSVRLRRASDMYCGWCLLMWSKR